MCKFRLQNLRSNALIQICEKKNYSQNRNIFGFSVWVCCVQVLEFVAALFSHILFFHGVQVDRDVRVLSLKPILVVRQCPTR